MIKTTAEWLAEAAEVMTFEERMRLMAAAMDGRQCFTYEVPNVGIAIWDVRKANELADAGQITRTVEIDRHEMEGVMTRNEWTQSRVQQVDPTQSGIGAPIVVTDNGRQVLIYILIDGTHRCVRAVQQGRPYFARLLTDEASRQSLLYASPAMMPWFYANYVPDEERSRHDQSVSSVTDASAADAESEPSRESEAGTARMAQAAGDGAVQVPGPVAGGGAVDRG